MVLESVLVSFFYKWLTHTGHSYKLKEILLLSISAVSILNTLKFSDMKSIYFCCILRLMLPETYWGGKVLIFKYKKCRAQLNIKTAKFSDLKKKCQKLKNSESSFLIKFKMYCT